MLSWGCDNIPSPGSDNIPAVDPLVPQDVTTRGEDNKEDNHDAEEDEGDGAERNLIKISAGQCSRYR